MRIVKYYFIKLKCFCWIFFICRSRKNGGISATLLKMQFEKVSRSIFILFLHEIYELYFGCTFFKKFSIPRLGWWIFLWEKEKGGKGREGKERGEKGRGERESDDEEEDLLLDGHLSDLEAVALALQEQAEGLRYLQYYTGWSAWLTRCTVITN